MKAATRFSTALVLLALIGLFTTAASVGHAQSAQESHWVGNLYGSTELWGLGYSRPWARSSHHITVSNEGNFKSWYLYEFKISVLSVHLESKHPTTPVEEEIDAGVTVMIPGHMNLDLRKAAGIDNGELFTLSCYTRIALRTKFNGKKQWKVTLERPFFK